MKGQKTRKRTDSQMREMGRKTSSPPLSRGGALIERERERERAFIQEGNHYTGIRGVRRVYRGQLHAGLAACLMLRAQTNSPAILLSV